MSHRCLLFIAALLISQSTTAQDFGDEQIISTEVDNPLSVHTGDLNGNGNMDVLSPSMSDNKIAWYENLGITVELDELSGNNINLFPNPMTTSAMLDLGELRGRIQLEIYDVMGKLQRSELIHLDQGTLNLERGALPSGTYILRLTQEDEAMELKFVVE